MEADKPVGLEFYNKKIMPYLSWLESFIETHKPEGFEELLKQITSTTHELQKEFTTRISHEEFIPIVQRILSLFDLAAESFPEQEQDIEKHADLFIAGIRDELGEKYLPEEHKTTTELLETPSRATADPPGKRQKQKTTKKISLLERFTRWTRRALLRRKA